MIYLITAKHTVKHSRVNGRCDVRKRVTRLAAGLALFLVTVALVTIVLFEPTTGKAASMPAACARLAFSTEEDFVTQGPEPSDGNPIISDGDLLGDGCVVCARNLDLVGRFDVNVDLGLDAADVIDTEEYLVAFSTELNSPNTGQFTAGDLLVTDGTIIPNVALTYLFDVGYDIGLDAVHLAGKKDSIIAFLEEIQQYSRDYWVESPDALSEILTENEIDIWFSTEETAPTVESPAFLDGDLLSARDGIIVARNSDLLPSGVPAGIPSRGVDFGLDAATSSRSENKGSVRFSTELLYEGQTGFTDGDVLRYGNGVVQTNDGLIGCFEPKADFLGLDALHMTIEDLPRGLYLPIVLRGLENVR
jgi:hypothetical protein